MKFPPARWSSCINWGINSKKTMQTYIPWQWMKEHNYALQTLQNDDTCPRLQSRTQNMSCYVDFCCYFVANGQNHIHFQLIQVLKNSMAWHFLTFTKPAKLEFVYPPCCAVKEQMLIFSSSLTPGWVKGSWIEIQSPS